MTPKSTGDDNDRLFQRALIVHAVGIILIVWCNHMGWLTKVFTTDTFYISRTIIGLGAFALLVGTAKLWGFTRELNIAKKAKQIVAQDGKKALFSFLSSEEASRTSEFVQQLVDAGPANRSFVTRSFVMKLERKAGTLNHFLEVLPMLGLLGTGVGIISAFSALSSDLTQSAPLAVPGFMIALITTALGVAFTIWLLFICRLISDGAGQLTEILLAFDLDGGKDE